MRDGRRPGAIPDDVLEGGAAIPAAWAADTDADGRPDTLLTRDGADLLVLTDLDGDGLADRVLRIDPEGSVHLGHPGGSPEIDHDEPVPGHAPAVDGPWHAVLRWCGLTE